MIYNKLTDIPIRNYLKAVDGDLSALNHEGKESNEQELNEAYNSLVDEKIDSFGIDNEALNILELESKMAQLLADHVTDNRDLTQYLHIEAELNSIYEKIEVNNKSKSSEAHIISMIHRASDYKIILSPINNTAYEMLTALKSLNNVR